MTATTDRTISPQVQTLLPNALILYLWNMADLDSAGNQTFLLKKQDLNGSDIQEIVHFYNGAFIDSRKVFGFEPVNAVIHIAAQGDTLRMKTGGLLESVAFVAG